MLTSQYITGKVIEHRDNSVLTVEGEVISRYNLGYYRFINVDEPIVPKAEEEYKASKWKVFSFRKSG